MLDSQTVELSSLMTNFSALDLRFGQPYLFKVR